MSALHGRPGPALGGDVLSHACHAHVKCSTNQAAGKVLPTLGTKTLRGERSENRIIDMLATASTPHIRWDTAFPSSPQQPKLYK
jgi:hypothetical protein